MASRETNQARQERDTAAAAWRAHNISCSQCRKKPVTPRCNEGGDLYRIQRQAQSKLDEHRAADRQPIEGQIPLL